MRKTIGIGIQNFEKIKTHNIFYIDKTRKRKHTKNFKGRTLYYP